MRITEASARGVSGPRLPRILVVILAAAGLTIATVVPASAHYPEYYLQPNGPSQNFTVTNPSCSWLENHGNYANVAYSKTLWWSGTSCYSVGTYVTGCSGLNCPNGPYRSGSSYNTWYQSDVAWVSVVASHFFTNVGGSTTVHHARAFP